MVRRPEGVRGLGSSDVCIIIGYLTILHMGVYHFLYIAHPENTRHYEYPEVRKMFDPSDAAILTQKSGRGYFFSCSGLSARTPGDSDTSPKELLRRREKKIYILKIRPGPFANYEASCWELNSRTWISR